MTTYANAITVLLSVVLVLAPLGAARGEVIHLAAGSFDPALGEPEVPSELSASERALRADGFHLVQLAGPPTDERKAAVESAGGEIIAYVPDNTYVVRMDGAVRATLLESHYVLWIGPFHPAYKIDPATGTHEFRDPRRASDPLLTLRVRVFDDLAETSAQLEALGARVLETSDDGFQKLVVVHARPELLYEIAHVTNVWWIEEEPEFYLANDLTKWVVQSGVSGSTPIWDKGLHGENQVVGVMDSGLDYNSCWFRDTGAAPPGPSHRKVIDYTLYGGGLAYDGCDIGHGTHVCGTLAGDQSFINSGNYDYNGMAYEAKLIMQDVGADDEWSCTVGQISIPTSLTAAFNDAYGLGARIHSNSWGGTGNTYDSYCVNVDNFMWNNTDFLIVFAAGNSGPGAATVYFPGTAKNCITVGATRRPPSEHIIAGYSSRGPAFDDRYKPTVTAPGGEAGYSYVNSADNDIGNPPASTCLVASSPFQGTSMAAPAVAGCAALTRQYFEEGWYPTGTETPADGFAPSAALLKASIVNSAADMTGSGAPPAIPNYDEGWGRVLMDDVLYFDGDARELIIEDVTPGVGQSEIQSFEFEVDSGLVPLEIVLVWTDYPATSGASVAIQNDLDLTVEAPGGATYKGNVFSGGESVTGGTYDNRNVEEVVRFESPTTGTYSIDVQGSTVPHAPQHFALVSTGSFANWPGGTAVDDGTPGASTGPLKLAGVFPNPFNPRATIVYELLPVGIERARTTLRILGTDGRLVATLVDRVQDPGRYSVTWTGRDRAGLEVASGVYFCELSYGGAKETRKMTLLR